MANQVKYRYCGALLGATFALTLALIWSQLGYGAWKELFLYNGDSITLALVAKSIFRAEKFNWVFSSQTFLFPEGPIYFLSYLFSENFKAALFINAYFNILSIIALLILIARHALEDLGSRLISITIFLVLISTAILSEATPSININTIVTLILFNTYYSGVVLSSLLMLYLLCKLGPRDHFSWSYFILSVLIGGLTYGSDPLLLLQFLMPLVAVAFVFLKSALFRYQAKILFSTVVLSLSFGSFVRYLTSDFISRSVTGYLNFKGVWHSFLELSQIFIDSHQTPQIFVLWLLWLTLFFIHFICFINLVYKNKQLQNNYAFLLIHGVCIFIPVITVMGVLISGNSLTRYLLPIPFFIFIGICLLAPYILSAKKLFLIGSFGFIFISTMTVVRYQSLESLPLSSEIDIQCYKKINEVTELTSVGSFWTSRQLDLYGNNRVYQVSKELTPYNWLVNRYEDAHININSVVIDKVEHPAHVNAIDIEALGPPSKKFDCARFFVYRFDKDTPGYVLLNQKFNAAVDHRLESNATPISIVQNKTYIFSAAKETISGKGWSGRESWGRWTDQKIANLQFNLGINQDSDLKIIVEGQCFLSEKLKEQWVTISANDYLLKRFQCTLANNGASQSITISRNMIAEDGALNIKFVIDNPTSPSQLGLSTDGRKLGFGLISMRFNWN